MLCRYNEWLAADGQPDAIEYLAAQCEEQLQQVLHVYVECPASAQYSYALLGHVVLICLSPSTVVVKAHQRHYEQT